LLIPLFALLFTVRRFVSANLLGFAAIRLNTDRCEFAAVIRVSLCAGGLAQSNNQLQKI
jgi:hypothetical protein